MRESKIINNIYLGPYHHPAKLSIGSKQTMQFELGDVGPFYLSPEERVCRMLDVESEDTKIKKYTKAQLKTKIELQTNLKPKGTLKETQSMAEQLNIPIQFKQKNH